MEVEEVMIQKGDGRPETRVGSGRPTYIEDFVMYHEVNILIMEALFNGCHSKSISQIILNINNRNG